MKIFESVGVIRKENPLLFWVGLLHFLLAVVLLILVFVDDVQLMGVNRWIKPLKFSMSIGVYLWTFGWLLRYLTNQRTVRFISWGITVCMLVEMIIIAVQAGRGVSSHYNISSALNATLFSVMGTFIGINSVLILHTWVLFVFGKTTLDSNMRLAWQSGLFLFLLGGLAGGMMIGNLGHNIGVPDGGDGIPLLNWSTLGGDLRSAHFFTLHGLQAIPLFAFFISAKTKQPRLFTCAFSILYTLICMQLHHLALSGQPFIDFFSV
jgi:hypothetical protein